MTAKSVTETIEDSSTEQVVEQNIKSEKKSEDVSVEAAKLASLKAKSQAKQQESKMASKIVAKKERSLALGFCATGQCGGRLGAVAHAMGYPTVAINSAATDLKNINIPDANKLLLNGTLGGAAKDRSIGLAAAQANEDQIAELVNDKLSSCQVIVLCSSLSGGSGSGSLPCISSVLAKTGKPIVCLCVLPLESDDVQSKQNSLEALAELAKLVESKVISNLLIVDNAKLEAIFASASQVDFYRLANEAVMEPIDVFNTLSAQDSPLTKAIDNAEFARLLIGGEGVSVFGSMEVRNFEEDTAIAEAIINNLSNNLLASDLDLRQAKYIGFIITGSEKSWAKIPSSSLNYASSMVEDFAGTPLAIYKGFYVTPEDTDYIKIYSCFSGMGLPSKRIDALKKQTENKLKDVAAKEEKRSLNLTLDTGKNDTISAAQKIKDKISAKNSAFSKLAGVSVGGTVDRRK